MLFKTEFYSDQIPWSAVSRGIELGSKLNFNEYMNQIKYKANQEMSRPNVRLKLTGELIL